MQQEPSSADAVRYVEDGFFHLRSRRSGELVQPVIPPSKTLWTVARDRREPVFAGGILETVRPKSEDQRCSHFGPNELRLRNLS